MKKVTYIFILTIGLFSCFPIFANEVGDTISFPSALDFLIMAWDNSTWWQRCLLSIPVIHPILLAFFAWTDTPNDEIIYGKIYKFIEKMVGITDKTKQLPKNKQ